MNKRLTFDDYLLLFIFLASFTVLALTIAGVFGPVTVTAAFAAIAVPGTAGGRHVADGPLTTALANDLTPGLLRNEIDERVTKLRPSATPIDTISRLAGSRRAASMVVDYYAVDTKPGSTAVLEALDTSTASLQGNAMIYTLKTRNDAIFDATETILLPEYDGYNEAGEPCGHLVLYVVGRNASGGINVLAVNGEPDSNNSSVRTISEISRGAKLVRMGRAAAELDVQTPQFNALPRKSTNYCQIFKAQVEQSTFQKLADKEVGWTLSDQEETAILDMRQCLERSFLFGSKGRIYDPEKGEEIMLTGGIWEQAGNEFTYSDDTTNDDFIIGLCRRAFTGNAGSSRKILVAGTDLIDYLSRNEATRVLMAGDTVTRWGIDFKELQSKFGTLYVIHSEVFDSCGMSHNGMVIDPEYITKYSHVPFKTETLDLKKSGQRNTDAVVITEASCLVLRYPTAHCRVVKVED